VIFPRTVPQFSCVDPASVSLIKWPMKRSQRVAGLLYEDDIKKAVAKLLIEKGYGKPKIAGIREHGPDIVAPTPDGLRELWVEAKGETSSNIRSRRYGKPFDSKQKPDHLGKAVLKSLQWMSSGPDVLSGFALPADEEDVALIDSIAPALKWIRIAVFLVHKDGRVDIPFGIP
jgi:hypothetical protein